MRMLGAVWRQTAYEHQWNCVVVTVVPEYTLRYAYCRRVAIGKRFVSFCNGRVQFSVYGHRSAGKGGK